MCSKPKTGYHAETVRNLCRVTDIIFSKCSNIGVLKLTQPFDRQNLPLAAFAGRIGAFAIHGSSLALGNVLLPSCWETYRTLRKSNILHKAQIPDCLSVVSLHTAQAHFHKSLPHTITYIKPATGSFSCILWHKKAGRPQGACLPKSIY